MKVAGIIAEYNPLHSGHVYQIEDTRKQTGADYIVVAMSGSYTQRGIPAFFDKYLRTEMALNAGADLVLELPVSVSTGSGEYFAKGAVTLLNSLGVVTHLSFGSECGDIRQLRDTASFLLNETPEFKALIQKLLAEGQTYPAAVNIAAGKLGLPMAELLGSPNNILGIEYIKSLMKLNSSIEPVTVQRQGSGYNETEITHIFPSATALRNLCKKGNYKDLLNFLPNASQKVIIDYNLSEDGCYITEEDFSQLLIGKLLYTSDLSVYADVNPELANRIKNILPRTRGGFTELVAALKTRQITQARIQRALFHIILEIQDETMQLIKDASVSPYIRVLGMKENSSSLLKKIKEKSDVPLIMRPAKDIKQLSGSALELMNLDFKAYDLYRLIWKNKYPHIPYSPREDYKGMLVK